MLPFDAAAEDSSGAVLCPPLFDNASCYPATPAGLLMEIPCMEQYHGIRFNTSGEEETSSAGFGVQGNGILVRSALFPKIGEGMKLQPVGVSFSPLF